MPDDPAQHASRTARGAAELELGDPAVELLRSRLPEIAGLTVTAIIVEVPAYTNALAGPMGPKIAGAVQLALGGFLRLASSGDPGTPLAPALEGAYVLGRGEARSGRTMDALLAAYRVGARVSWRELSRTAVEAGLSADTLARFAELVFAYIDELSAASVSGHTDELATTGRVRERYLQELGLGLLHGDPAEQLTARAERADWEPPRTLTAVLLPSAHVRSMLGALDPRTLRPEADLQDLAEPGDSGEPLGEDAAEVAVLLVPDADGSARAALLRNLRGYQAWVGPPQPWATVRTSYQRALRARNLGLTAEPNAPVDTERHLTTFVVTSDSDALDDLRRQVLAPFAALRPATAERLAETLREWLLHLGRRDEVAAALHVHPQTVRYRMGQIRDLYGARLDDPNTVLSLTIALATPPRPTATAPADV
ncbi:helix-turn-helix domain-containing protein [Streptomyces sp. SID13031]|uniref:PucR family transcriptional regulator n=1 Tax=Streptomyces sp. SID13031 TaxID=2706046 RepID=UPI0013C800D6|nr:helix-turn-helix domain-containing protein [Streptomyces sp. SID13031]NEA30502.1 PucR family transcriptional regulator [Streptomyces sp. SID13031]